jgi:serine/threonine protein kinase
VDGGAPGSGGFLVSYAAGSRIAGYRLESRIGQGGMAVVYRARDERLGRLVALKILAPALAGDEEFQRRFVSESQAAAAMDDPHVVPVFAAGEEDGVLFIAMRYVPGGDAHMLLKREGPLPPARVAEIISAVASALDAAHRAGLLHRDVKPSNMLMDIVSGRPDHVYLSDFGLSKAAASAVITQAGYRMGTPDYTSPEQCKGQPADGRADQYALACSAFELLTGTLPFHRDDSRAVVYSQISEPPPSATSRQTDLPEAIDGVLVKALAKAPGDRYASCGEFADALREAFGFEPYHSGPQVRRVDRHTPTEKSWPGQTSDPGVTADPPADVNYADTTTGGFNADRGPDGSGQAATGNGAAGSGQIITDSGAGGDTAPPLPPLPLPPPSRRPRRRTLVAAGAAMVVLAGGLTAGLLSGGSGGKSPVVHRSVDVPISVGTQNTPVAGDVYVAYDSGKYSNAQISGEVKKAASGEVARLYAQPFPYKHAPVQAGSVILHPGGGTASYGFQVTPSAATHYRVELFRNGTAMAPLGTSAMTTIYVIMGESDDNARVKHCGYPVCHLTLHQDEFVPPSAMQTELAKPWYLYFAVNLAPVKIPPSPQTLMLGAGTGQVTTPHRIAANQFSVTITFTFRIGNDASHWSWFACTKENLAQDGIGLPGDHGCGAARISASSDYTG